MQANGKGQLPLQRVAGQANKGTRSLVHNLDTLLSWTIPPLVLIFKMYTNSIRYMYYGYFLSVTLGGQANRIQPC